MTAGSDRSCPDQPGRYVYAIEAWTDEFATWRHGFELKQKAGADLSLDAIEGAGMLTKAQAGGHAAAAVILRQCEEFLQTGEAAPLLTDELMEAMAESQLRHDLTRSPLFPLMADRPRARNGAWYEMMPRSQGKTPGQHGTFKDCIARLPDIAAMGFDVVYFTPDPPDRPYQPQGPQQRGDAGRGRSRQPLCHRRRRRRPRCGASGTGHAGGLPRAGRGLQVARHGSRARLRRAVLAGPSLAETASAMVQAAAGRLDALCRKSAEEIRGHRQPRFRIRGCRRAVECACATSCCSGSSRA